MADASGSGGGGGGGGGGSGWDVEPKEARRARGVPRFIVFIVGGASYQELQALQNLAAKKDVEIILGTDATLSAGQLIDVLGSPAFAH